MKRVISASAKPLATLAEINLTLTTSQNLRAGLQRALELLDQQQGVIRSAVVLVNPDSGRLQVEASDGLTLEGGRAEWEMGRRDHRTRRPDRQTGRRATD